MRRYQPSLCPWSHSAALHLVGSGAQLLAELQPASQTALSHSGIRGVWEMQPLVWPNFGQKLLLKFPPLSATTSPLLFLPGRNHQHPLPAPYRVRRHWV